MAMELTYLLISFTFNWFPLRVLKLRMTDARLLNWISPTRSPDGKGEMFRSLIKLLMNDRTFCQAPDFKLALESTRMVKSSGLREPENAKYCLLYLCNT